MFGDPTKANPRETTFDSKNREFLKIVGSKNEDFTVLLRSELLSFRRIEIPNTKFDSLRSEANSNKFLLTWSQNGDGSLLTEPSPIDSAFQIVFMLSFEGRYLIRIP